MKTELFNGGKRGRKPGSSKEKREKRISQDEAFQEALETRLETLQSEEGLNKVALLQKAHKRIKEVKSFSEQDVKRALRRSKIFQGLIKQGRIKSYRTGNLRIWADPKLHFIQFESLK